MLEEEEIKVCCKCLKLRGTVSGITLPATLTLTYPNASTKTFVTDSSGAYSKSYEVLPGAYTLSVGGVDYAFTKNKCDQCVTHNFVVGADSGIFVEQFSIQFV